MTTPAETAPTYSFGRRDRGGLLLGFRANQLVILGCGLVAVLLGLVTNGERGGVIGFVLLGVTALVALYPVQGRALIDWVRPVANYWHGRILGTAHYLGGPHALHRCGRLARMDLPGL